MRWHASIATSVSPSGQTSRPIGTRWCISVAAEVERAYTRSAPPSGSERVPRSAVGLAAVVDDDATPPPPDVVAAGELLLQDGGDEDIL